MRRIRTIASVSALAAATALVLSSCSSTPEPGTTQDDEEITLTMSWWGNDTRSANTQKIIDAFEAEHPNVTIEPTFSDYGSYWDKLATQTAANDTPDIMQMDEIYLSTYANDGVLLDLTDLGIDTADIPQSSLESGEIDGKLYALAQGVAAYAMVLNPALFEQAGVALPDDPNWTWDDFLEVAEEVSAGSGGQYSGFASSFGFDEGSLRLWARQHGESVFTEDGEIGLSPDTVASYFDFVKDASESGAMPEASALQEGQGAGLSETFLATGKAAMGSFWNNQLSALTDAVGAELTLLPVPESVDDYFLKPSALWTGSSRTEHPEVVAEFIDFMVNSEEQADIQSTERGIPNNEAIREYIAPNLSPADQAAIAFFDEITPTEGEAVTPAGGSQMTTMLPRYMQQVLFGQTSSEDAAQGFLDELQSALDSAR